MYKERASWEKYRERLFAEAREFEQMKNKFLEEKATFEKEKKSEEWGRDDLKSKLHVAEELLAKERQEWKKICDNDYKRMYAARTKITNLEAEIVTLKGKVEEAQADRERFEVELNVQIVSKNKDLASKGVEIVELKRRLFEAHEKKIDLVAENVRADTTEEARKAAEEARDISTSGLNVAHNNYVEAQSIVVTLVSESEWMRNHGVAALSISLSRLRLLSIGYVANSILNATELDQAVATLIDVVLSQAEEVYDHLSLPVMELVTEALKHDNYVARLKFILVPPETVELSDEVEVAGDGGDE
ncbi:hypothetical protein Hanom_Chr06g00497521 [Helianthus anomalus]